MDIRPATTCLTGARRALVCGALATAAILMGASAAGARVIHTRGGHFLGVGPRGGQGAPRAAPRALSPLTAASGGGALVRADATDPYPLPATYPTLIDGFFTDVTTASAASASDNVYAVSNQYGAAATAAVGASHYSSTFGRDLSNTSGNRDTDPFPADGPHGNSAGCDPAPLTAHQAAAGDPSYGWCVTDTQIQTELNKLISAGGLPTDSSAVYFVFLPPGVDVCGGPGPEAPGTTGNPCADTDFCAYHSAEGMASGPLYAVIPWADISGCQSGNHPNSDPADDTINVTSHEHMESITDPFGTSWMSAAGNEIGDLCAAPDVFGSPLGGTPGTPASPGTAYNQIIGAHHYWLQDEFANLRNNGLPLDSCQQRPANMGDGLPGPAADHGPLLNPGAGPVLGHHTVYSVYWYPGATPSPPTASFTKSRATARPGDPVGLDASASSDPQGQPLTYSWDFGDGTTGSGVSVSHAYSAPGDHVVTLTVNDTGGFSAGTSQSVHVFTPPTASFTGPTGTTFAGQPLAFDASASGGPEAPITAYAWTFGDGSGGAGVRATHTYGAAGVYSVTLTITDANGITSSSTQQFSLSPPPPAAIAASGSPRATLVTGGVLISIGRTVTCPTGASSCTTTVTLTSRVTTRVRGRHRSRTRSYTIGTARIVIAAGHGAVIKVRLNAQGRSLLRRLRRLGVTAQISVTGTGIASTHSTLSFRISQPRSPRRGG